MATANETGAMLWYTASCNGVRTICRQKSYVLVLKLIDVNRLDVLLYLLN